MDATNTPALVRINGFPGPEKLTVVTDVAALHKPTTVLDNQKLIDPVEQIVPRSYAECQRERQLYRKAILDQYACYPATLSRLVCLFHGLARPDCRLDQHATLEMDTQILTFLKSNGKAPGP